MRRVSHLTRVAIVLSAVLFAIPAISEARCCRRIGTEFGNVLVESRDVLLATTLGDHVRTQAKDVLQLNGVRFTIEDATRSKYKWADKTPEGLSVYPWRFVHGTRYVALYPPNAIFPHEVAHDLLERYLVPSTRLGQYGTDAPDWVDESVAIAFEMPEDKVWRRCQAVSLAKSGALIPLERFLTMVHPDLESIQKADPSSRDLKFESTMSQDTPAFYAMSIAFPEYLAERTASTSILAELVDAFLKGKRLNDWIGSRLAAADHAPDIKEIERSFAVWIRSSDAYSCTK